MYPKGGNMLHTIRQIVNDDEKWREMLRGLNKTFYHQTVDGSQIEQYISQQAGRNLSKVFDQYLRDIRIPQLEYSFAGKTLKYRWTNVVSGFDMPVKIKLAGSDAAQLIYPTSSWKTLKTKGETSLTIDRNFYVTGVAGMGN